jgi:hypothetical protein
MKRGGTSLLPLIRHGISLGLEEGVKCAQSYRVSNKSTQLSTSRKNKSGFSDAWQFAFTLVGLAHRPLFFGKSIVPACGARYEILGVDTLERLK